MGLVAWTVVLADFVLAFGFRRSSLRFIWACTAIGWPLFFVREMKWLKPDVAWALAIFGVTAGIAFAALLVARYLTDPKVLT
jgi:hypothetical protein